MSKKSNFTVPVLLVLAVFVMLAIPFFIQAENYQEHNPLEYDVEVRAQIIPIYAVDTRGEPVLDLKEEDIEFFINGKPGKITLFTAYTMQEEVQKENNKPSPTGRLDLNLKKPRRINFMLIDSVSNTKAGIRHTKRIVEGIIKQSAPEESFVIMESHPFRGLLYIIGPETDKKKLIASLSKLSNIDANRSFTLGEMLKEMGAKPEDLKAGSGGLDNSGRWSLSSNTVGEPGNPLAKLILDTGKNKSETDKQIYREILYNFYSTVSQMKYLFQSIPISKNVYLISGGVATDSLGTNFPYYYEFMGSAAQAINAGGSTLNIIDPIPWQSPRFTNSLKHIASVGGGKYFGGHKNFNTIISDIKKNTQAYYEISFFPGTEKKIKIDVKCKRKDVTLNTINNLEKTNPYKDMSRFQKELFAINVVTGGSWSRMAGKIQKANFQAIQSSNSDVKRILIPIPEKMKGLNVDIMVMNMNPNTLKAQIDLTNQKAGSQVEMEVPIKKGKVQYILVVEPLSTRCLYNQVL